MNGRSLFVCMAVAINATCVLAHGPQMQVSVGQNKLVTGDIFLDEPYAGSPTGPKSVYVMPVLPYNGQWYSQPNTTYVAGLPKYLSGPGINFGLASASLAAGSTITMSFTDELKRWNGSSFVGGAAVTEQVQAFSGSNFNPSPVPPTFVTASTADTGPFASIPMATTAVPPASDGVNAHATRRFRLFGESGEPADGIYLLSMQLSTSSPDIGDSDVYHFLLNKNADMSEVSAAVEVLGFAPSAVQIVPEPAAISLGIAGLPLAFWGLRRRWARSHEA